jgi:uncharacterized membrane protein YeaQ/YmgE (transglycosylase-associated protein family)
MSLQGLLIWSALGLVAGILAKLIMPGRQGMNPITTVLLGIVGSIIGGKVGHLIGWGVVGEFSIKGIITAVGGALIFMYVWQLLFGKKGGGSVLHPGGSAVLFQISKAHDAMRILRYFIIVSLMAAGIVFLWARSFSPDMTEAADYEQWLRAHGGENGFSLVGVLEQEKVPTLKESMISLIRYWRLSHRCGLCRYAIQGSDGGLRDLEMVSADGKIVVCDPLPVRKKF